MQVTIDIPEPLYSALKSSAEEENTSVSDFVLKKVGHWTPVLPKRSNEAIRVDFPLIRGTQPGPLMRDDVNLNHVAFMDQDEINEPLAGR